MDKNAPDYNLPCYKYACCWIFFNVYLFASVSLTIYFSTVLLPAEDPWMLGLVNLSMGLVDDMIFTLESTNKQKKKMDTVNSNHCLRMNPPSSYKMEKVLIPGF